MESSRFTTEQIIGILQEHAAGARTAELLRRHGISRPMLYAWKKRFGDPCAFHPSRSRVSIQSDHRFRFMAISRFG